MTVVDSRVKTGLLELSADGIEPFTSFACQPTSVIVEPSYADAGDPVEVLCGDSLAGAATMTWNFKITAIQDFDSPTGLMAFLRDHALMDIWFSFTPNATAEIVSGKMQARPGPWYGEVATRLTTELDMPINGTPTWTPQV